MLRRLLLTALLLGLTAPGVIAQQDQVGTRIYVALFNIKYSDIPQWTADYYDQGVPILEALVAEGAITAFNILMHHTGGEYSIRQGLIGDDDTDYEAVWDTYLGQLAQANATAFERSNRMILAHVDEVWNIDVSNIPNGGDTQYLYEAQFQVNFADMERWNELWAEDLLPTADQAMADGLLQGYVVEGHNTGGRFNWKILFFYDEWDNFNEIEAAIFEAAPLDHPVWSMSTAHKDELWQALPPPN